MLDLIVPCYDEEKVLKNFYDKCVQTLIGIKYKIIFVNDGSNDKSLDILKSIYENDKERVRIVSFSRNFGKESAIYAGLSNSKSKYACIIDADLQQNPKYVMKMFEFLEKNEEYDAVCMCQKQKKKRFIQNTFYKTMNSLSDIRIENGASDFRMFRNYVVKSILELSEKNRFSKGLFSYVGYNTYYDGYTVEERKAGKTKWGTMKLVNYATNGIFAFSTKPLRFVTYSGVITSIAAIIYLLIILIKTLILGKETAGYASLMCVILFIGGFLLIGLGIVGEYIGKIYTETKNRPIYVTKEKIGFDEEIL